MEKTFFTYGIAEIIKLGTPLLPEPIPRAVKRKRAELLQYLDGLPDAQKLVLADAARQTQGTKRKAKNQGRGTRPKKAKTAASEQLERETHVDALDATSVIATNTHHRYIDRTGNEALRKAVCMICARRLLLVGQRHVDRRGTVPVVNTDFAGAAFNRLVLSGGGNVSTYRLNTADIAGLAAGNTMPPSPKILAATIGVTFVGVGTKPLTVLPDFLHVRRQRVFEALLWLKDNNSLYSGINISKEQLQLLPEDDVPEEISLNAKYSDDVASLQREQAGIYGYVNLRTADACVFPMLGGTPTPFPLQAMGVVDAHGEGVPDSDLFAHAFSNAAEGVAFKDFGIRKSSAFVNEYPRLDEQNERFDGGPTNPNHMLGAFPVLFPYGFGGIEVDRSETVPYEAHVRWALQYDDSRFRKDFYFIFQAFGVLQKRQVCRSAGMQIKRSSFIANQVAFMNTEETRRVPFSNPTLTSLRARVQGTDESRISIRSQVWGTNLRFNPATVWATWNMSDTGDPMAQVLVGEEINMDDFIATSGPNRDKRASNIAGDPYAAAEFFHTNVLIILEEMLGIKVVKRGSIQRKEGILGFINAYIATVEAQARGTLHIHILFWVDGAPTAAVMREALQSAAFREKMARFIKQNIRADIKGTDALSVLAMKKESNIAYARPVDPRCENYELLRHATEARVARAVQTHNCTVNTCLRTVDGRLTCKRRAPWALASEDWVEPNGEWGPRRVYGRMNAWNPALLQILHSNQDMKLVTNGHETKDITFYITLYIAKKQIQAANASALLAKSVAMHKKLNRRQTECKDINKRLITQCANTLSRQHEFSGPEVVSYLMGWGDRFISHNFVSIYWDQVTSALRKTFPTLSNRR
ncbi:hypothetical protein B0H15DRAFT_919234 [Mycena belliarum]|uniref:Helitron helicase-like domain-containing protein n=1 Tax=Mycena belliarum TaxID=1033014 RepID=A0AAD6UHN4_9AGAR|nr:hypothetical protein B0H15DRAFT_919234 [Mycena belliae]